ncbi:cobalt-zinc-cadmium efflux system membrane fusion protein [Salinibacter ruber]|uniref:Cobalt-zinc-cadmium efflux system membrane fusion protein n=1 Tax=Salinibacter ruber TaxID=146919 RepID=A0A9X2PYI7_9BACT|nr:efflux RND transporter periplasmic adaptor subunit [Salinibacter ruber]MCS3676256.1 cobalt-zinc-cadmium efflux system membrane fusion protein [Salinibacter ruber]MCS3679543.1 cobalt-zinc-cadmium efflux system membrane fusion protein [Salinibacter ruber]
MYSLIHRLQSTVSFSPGRLPVLLSGLLLAAVLGAGCGGGQAEPSAGSAASTQQAAPDTTQEDGHETGGTASHGESGHGEERHADAGSHDDGGHQEGEHSGEHGGEHEGGARGIEIGTERARQLGIEVRELQGGSATSTVSRPATVQFDPNRVARVGPRIEGKIVRVTKDLGDRVREGEAVAVMSSVELGKAKSRYLTTKARLKTHRRAYEREQALRADSITSEAELLEAQAQFEQAQAEFQAAKEELRLYGISEADVAPAGEREMPISHFRVTSPVTGTLQRRDVEIGQTVSAQETPFHVAGSSRMWVMIDGYERDVPVVEEGQRVRLTVSSMPEASFEGRIDFISQTLEEETRTLRLRAVIPNREDRLRDGMYGRAHISTEATVERALISTDAVQTIDGSPMVFVPGEEDGHFRAVEVRLGDESQSGMVELLSGLQPGDAAVTEGAFDLKAALTSQARSASHSH